jgi:drug/metabolite transporter (DMT)-like permease
MRPTRGDRILGPMNSAAEADAIVLRTAAPDRLALGAFTGAVVIGGSNFVAIRFSNRELDPLWGAGLRFTLAAAVFGLLFAALRLSLPRGRALVLVAAYGVLAFGGAYGCLYWAMQEVPAGIAAVVLAAGPLLTLLLAVVHGMERLSRGALVGALVALVGSVVIFFQPGSVSFGWRSFALLGVAALCASESVVVSKLAGQHPVAMNFVGMSVGSVVLLVVAGVAGERLVLPADDETQLAVAYLVAATVGLFLLVLFVVQRWTASATSYAFVLMPVIAVALGALVADEAIAVTTVVGGTIVCAGVYVGARRS